MLETIELYFCTACKIVIILEKKPFKQNRPCPLCKQIDRLDRIIGSFYREVR